MNQRRLVMLLGMLAVLLAVAYATGVFDEEISTVSVPELSIPVDQIDRIALRSPADVIWSLSRNDAGRWSMVVPVAYPADSTAVRRFVEALDEFQLASVVSTNRERYSRFGVDSTANKLSIEWNGESKEIVLGNEGSDFTSRYVRVMGDERVFSSTTRLDVQNDPDQLRDRTLVSIPAGSVVSAEVSTDDYQYTLTVGTSGWEISQDGIVATADSAAVENWLRRFASVKASGFVADVSPEAVRATPGASISFVTTGGPRQIYLLALDDQTLAAAVTPSGERPDASFKLQAYQLATYLPEPSTLIGE